MPKYPFGTSVRARLRKLRRTQRQLAEAVHYSPSYISMLLSGRLHNDLLKQQISAVLTRWEAEA